MNHTFSVTYHDLKLQNKNQESGGGLQDSNNDKKVTFKDLFFLSVLFITAAGGQPLSFKLHTQRGCSHDIFIKRAYANQTQDPGDITLAILLFPTAWNSCCICFYLRFLVLVQRKEFEQATCRWDQSYCFLSLFAAWGQRAGTEFCCGGLNTSMTLIKWDKIPC